LRSANSTPISEVGVFIWHSTRLDGGVLYFLPVPQHRVGGMISQATPDTCSILSISRGSPFLSLYLYAMVLGYVSPCYRCIYTCLYTHCDLKVSSNRSTISFPTVLQIHDSGSRNLPTQHNTAARTCGEVISTLHLCGHVRPQC
jgi:hypothetical protein